ncbi:MAG: ABC transporter ATP-binding protein, partial [Clostridiaceae bacterium]|nr:ABC transporter ATP-binding protein [Clostridiaceae bacterium]
MLKLFKYLKSYSLYILLIIVALYIQAFSDLSLPDYMSKIVNIGIQQGGVENSIPEVIRESEYEKLKFLLYDEENQMFHDNYRLISKDFAGAENSETSLSVEEYESYLKKYPALSSENIYILSIGYTKNVGNASNTSSDQNNTASVKNRSKEDILTELNKFLGKKLLILHSIEKGNFNEIVMPSIGTTSSEKPAASPSYTDTDPFAVISGIPKEQRELFLKEIDKKLESMPESMITQSSVMYIKSEYEAIGIDTSRLQSKYILRIGLLMIGIAFVGMLATVLVGFLSARVSAGLGKILREKVFTKVTTFSNSEFDSFSTASLITRSTNDIQQVQMFMIMLLRMVFFAPVLGVGGIIKALSTNTSMAWIIAVGVLAILTLVIVLFSIAVPRFKKVQKLVDRVNLVIRESLVGMLVIRAFNTEKYQEEKFDKTNKDLTKINLFLNRLMSLMHPMMMLIMNGLTLLIIWVGAHQVDMGVIQVGDMMAFMQHAMHIIMSFLMISMVSIMLPRASVSAQRIIEVIDRDVVIKDPDNPRQLSEFSSGKKGVVEFRNVCFKYPDAEEYVISDISFTANPGETTAIIGSTGSGKSTIINLIPRFYDVTKGEILVDGVNIKDITQKELRRKIGVVPQRGVLYSGTIESNIKYGEQEVSDEDMIKAARIAQAEEFIEEKEEKYNSLIAQGGTNVSGGQKQRLSIARALAKKPEIFI